MKQGKQPFASPQEALAHYGVKGMHWGVRKKEDASAESGGGPKKKESTTNSDAVLDEYKALTKAQPQLKGSAAVKQLQENIDKSHNKLDDPGPLLSKGKIPPKASASPRSLARAQKHTDKANEYDQTVKELTAKRDALAPGLKTKLQRSSLNSQINEASALRDQHRSDAARAAQGKLTSGQKKALIAAGVGAVIVGGIVYSNYHQSQIIKDLERKVASGDLDAKLKLFDHQMASSKSKTWLFGGYIQDSSWDRPGFELPAGHTFHRISTRDESLHGFKLGTYATTSEADFNRYVAGFRQEKSFAKEFYHVTFTSSKPTKVPDLKTTIETLRESMGPNTSRSEALKTYQMLSGGSWESPVAEKFFANLTTKGYGAIVDEMDAGVIGDKPIVFFNKGNASKKAAQLLSSDEIAKRERAIELLPKPPRKA